MYFGTKQEPNLFCDRRIYPFLSLAVRINIPEIFPALVTGNSCTVIQSQPKKKKTHVSTPLASSGELEWPLVSNMKQTVLHKLFNLGNEYTIIALHK